MPQNRTGIGNQSGQSRFATVWTGSNADGGSPFPDTRYLPMDRLRKCRTLVFPCLVLLTAVSTGCRNRDLRVPPLPRYSNDPSSAPGPGAAIDGSGISSDPYGGLNPYASANLGSGSGAVPAGLNSPPYNPALGSAGDPYGGIGATSTPPPTQTTAPAASNLPGEQAPPPEVPQGLPELGPLP